MFWRGRSGTDPSLVCPRMQNARLGSAETLNLTTCDLPTCFLLPTTFHVFIMLVCVHETHALFVEVIHNTFVEELAKTCLAIIASFVLSLVVAQSRGMPSRFCAGFGRHASRSSVRCWRALRITRLPLRMPFPDTAEWVPEGFGMSSCELLSGVYDSP